MAYGFNDDKSKRYLDYVSKVSVLARSQNYVIQTKVDLPHGYPAHVSIPMGNPNDVVAISALRIRRNGQDVFPEVRPLGTFSRTSNSLVIEVVNYGQEDLALPAGTTFVLDFLVIHYE